MKPSNFSPMLCEEMKVETIFEHFDELKKLYGIVVEPKYDGVRAVIQNGRIYNRRGVDITEKFPEFNGLESIKGTFDGEIITESDKFSDIASRIHTQDAFKIKLLAKTTPAKFIAFDCIYTGEQLANGLLQYIADSPLEVRRKLLKEHADNYELLLKWFYITPQYEWSEFERLWDDVLENNKEGLVIKQKSSRYTFGRTSAWIKVKAWRETNAVFTSYETNPRGITIETNDERRVAINGAQAKEVAKIIDTNGSVTCEIQYLPQQDSDAWRFPSFKRISHSPSQN